MLNKWNKGVVCIFSMQRLGQPHFKKIKIKKIMPVWHDLERYLSNNLLKYFKHRSCELCDIPWPCCCFLLNRKLISWAWLTCLFFVPEILIKSLSNNFQVIRRLLLAALAVHLLVTKFEFFGTVCMLTKFSFTVLIKLLYFFGESGPLFKAEVKKDILNECPNN